MTEEMTIEEQIQNLHLNLGASMRTLREMAGMTQRQAAQKMRTTQAHVSDVENGKAKVSVAMIFRMAEAYDHDMEIPFYPKEEPEGAHELQGF